MRALHRKLTRDLWRLRGQLFAVALVVMCGGATLVTMSGAYDALVSARDRYYGDYRFADVFGTAKRAPRDLVRRIETIEGVATVDDRLNSPEFIYVLSGAAIFPDPKRYGILWMGRRSLEGRLDMTGAFNSFTLRLAPGASERAVMAAVDRLVAPFGARASTPRKDQFSHQMLDGEIQQDRVTGTIVPAIFLAVTAFLIHNVLLRLIVLQRAQIGLLKAFGYGRGAIGAARAAAQSHAAAACSDVQAAAAALMAAPVGSAATGHRVPLPSPVDGRVLRVLEASERTVAAGTPIMSIGDPAHLEVIADVLSTDAVKISVGMPARFEEWGGTTVLHGRVRRVEPYAFTKVSSLGIEEKRVNVVIDPIDTLGPLGDGYRVEARIIIWSSANALKIPASTLFRAGDGWAIFAVNASRAERRSVKVGARNAREAEVLGGIEEGMTVINFPSNSLREGMRVAGDAIR